MPNGVYKDKERRRLYMKKYNATRPPQSSEYYKAYKLRTGVKERYRDLELKRKYKISLKDYNDIFHRQSGNCAICHTNQSMFTMQLSVDHCHKTGKVRGLLCNNCNRCIGLLKDDTEVLKRAINYLK